MVFLGDLCASVVQSHYPLCRGRSCRESVSHCADRCLYSGYGKIIDSGIASTGAPRLRAATSRGLSGDASLSTGARRGLRGKAGHAAELLERGVGASRRRDRDFSRRVSGGTEFRGLRALTKVDAVIPPPPRRARAAAHAPRAIAVATPG